MSHPSYYNKDREEVIKYISINANKILDIGCGEGHFSHLIKKRQSAEVWGVEINEEAAKKATEKIDKVLIGDINKIIDQLPNNYFDCVVCNDILEHIYDPYSLVSKLTYKMSKDGLIVASLPNIRYFKVLYHLLISKRWDYKDYGVLDKTHVRFFTYKNIKELFEKNGYQTINIEGINPTKSLKYKIMNTLTLGYFWDSSFIQFICSAKPINRENKS